jgi:hypothetical protein
MGWTWCLQGWPQRGYTQTFTGPTCGFATRAADDARQPPCWNALSASAAGGAVPRLVIGGLPAGDPGENLTDGCSLLAN